VVGAVPSTGFSYRKLAGSGGPAGDVAAGHHPAAGGVWGSVARAGVGGLISVIGVQRGELILRVALAGVTAHRTATLREHRPLIGTTRATALVDRVRDDTHLLIPDIKS
jgi:hypothetical protein